MLLFLRWIGFALIIMFIAWVVPGINVAGFLNALTKEADKEILRLCEKYEVPVVVSSDAHVEEDILNFEYADALLCEVNFPLELIVNTSAEKLKTALKKRRETEQ